MTNTIPNVPRELLAELQEHIDCHRDAVLWGKVCALLSDPSPAGVDGCKCSMSISMLGDGCRHCQPQEYIDRLGEMLGEERSELSDAQAIIDGLRGGVAEERAKVAQLEEGIPRIMEASYQFRQQRDQQAQRIGELEGLLREVAASLAWNAHGECRAVHDGPIMPSQMALDAVKVALGGRP